MLAVYATYDRLAEQNHRYVSAIDRTTFSMARVR
jgi:hypothetical protein